MVSKAELAAAVCRAVPAGQSQARLLTTVINLTQDALDVLGALPFADESIVGVLTELANQAPPPPQQPQQQQGKP